MQSSTSQRVNDRMGVSGLLGLVAVAAVGYVITGDIFSAILGPAVVGLVIVSMAYAESTGTDVRYVKICIYAVGVAGGVVMGIAPTIPAWFGFGVTVVSIWLLADIVVDLYERDREQFPAPHSIEDTQQADIAVEIWVALGDKSYLGVDAIADRLEVGEERIEPVLADMCEKGLLERDDEQYRIHPEVGSVPSVLRRAWSRILRPARIVTYLT